jgi:hypothetical protein
MRKIRFRSLNCWALFVGVFLAATPFSWAQGQSNVVVVKATKRAFAPPLSQLVPIAPQSHPVSSPSDDGDLPMRRPRATAPVQDSILQTSVDAALSPAVATLPTNSGLDILGLGTGFAGYSIQAVVPDTNGAVGPTQFVQFVNESFAVFNKSNGSLAYGPAGGNTLWQALGGPCSSATNLDEIAQFDKLASRWVMMMPVFVEPEYLCIAVSTTSDATNGGWNLYAFEIPVSPQCGCRMGLDYPKLAVWPDGYYLSYNQGYNGTFMGAAVCVANRSAMLNGTAATMQCFINTTGTSYGTLLPADVDGTTAPPAGSPEYFASFDYNDQSLDLWQFHVNWTTPSSSTFTGPTNIPVAAFTEPCGETVTEITYTTGDCIPQAGTSQALDSYGDRLMYRLAYRNFGSYASLLVNHAVDTGTGTQTGIRWYELRNSGSGFGLYQQGTYAPDSNYRWMGSIAMDKMGDIALGYSVSSSTMSPSIRYTGRVPTDALGTMESEIDVLSSAGVANGSQTNTWHWADYSSMAIDPSDDCTFWYTTEYIPAKGGHWSTRIASFSFPSCTQSYLVTVSDAGQGTVTSTDGVINCTNGNGTCSAAYPIGSPVTMSATGASGWTFSGWSGSCSGGNPCNLVVNSNQSATATFSATNWAIVNKASNTGSPLTSLTIPSTGSGHVIVLGLVFNGTTRVTSVSDNAGNTYVSAGAHSAKGNLSTDIWYALNSNSGATSVTPAFAGLPTHVEMTSWEVAGLPSAAPDATSISSALVTLNNTTGPAVTTSQAGDFVVSILFANSAKFTSISAGNAFTDDFTTNGNGWAHLTSSISPAGTYQASWYTPATSGAYAASTVAFFGN